MNATMEAYCASKGNTHDKSVPRVESTNGIGERMNQTLNNMMRTMLFQYKSYIPLWAHVMVYVTLIFNSSLSVHLRKTR